MTKKNLTDNNNHNDPEVVFDDNIDGYEEPVLETKIKALKQELKSVQKEKTEYLNGWQRAQADYQNLKTKTTAEQKSVVDYAKIELLNELISLADSFEMAWSNKEAWEKAPSAWRVGIEHIYNQLLSILKNNQVEEIEATSSNFDPLIHEAVHIKNNIKPEEDSKITKVFKKGYKLHDKIIRPAQVEIGQLKQE
ncbi:MAG: nucleotide exchange factor GrpE [Candidatus Paceibacterota bacterium]